MNELDEKVPLDHLDPGRRDPGFWVRFHARVMEQAAEELARRREAGRFGIAEVVFAWRRALVPMALLAAALAGVVLMTEHESEAPSRPMALEEALMEDLAGDPIPTVLGRETELDEVAFLANSRRF